MLYNPNYFTPTAKFYGKMVMFWCDIKFSGEKDIVVIDGNTISAKYCKLLEIHLMENICLDKIFRQDNASCHNSKFSTKFFQENGFQLLENWPPQSPALNIIETLWNYLKQKIREKHPATVKELIRQVFETFLAIPDEYIHRLCRNIPRRKNAVLKNNGYQTKY